jgi:hypothetical protein
MQFEFQIGDLTLDKTEANTLLQAAEIDSTIKIDLSKHIDARYIDSQKLFTLSVERKNPALAALAAKLAIEGVQPSSKRIYRKTGEKKISSLEVDPMDPTEVLHTLLSTPSLKHVGAAMILHALQETNNQTIREMAIFEVNHLRQWWLLKNPNSDILRGFKLVNDEYVPIYKTASVDRAECFHASPIYTSLRDGLSFLVKSGLVLMNEEIEFGSNDRELKGTQSHLRRKVYKCSLSGRGRETAEIWADPMTYIARFWNNRSK